MKKLNELWKSKYLLCPDYKISYVKNFKECTKQVIGLIHKFNKVKKKELYWNTKYILID